MPHQDGDYATALSYFLVYSIIFYGYYLHLELHRDELKTSWELVLGLLEALNAASRSFNIATVADIGNPG